MAQAGFGQASLVPHTLFRELNKPPCQFTAAAIAQGNAAAQNEAMFAATIERGQQNMAQLEQAVIKDNTLLPGEWYGGQLHLAPPTDQGGGPKTYSIVITVGPIATLSRWHRARPAHRAPPLQLCEAALPYTAKGR